MAVISITVIPSSKQYAAGIPDVVTVTTNLPAMIFYTLDGTEPTASSSVYVGPIQLSREEKSIPFRVYATNGVDTDARLNIVYSADWTKDRLPRSKVTILSDRMANDGWCGGRNPTPQVLYSQPPSYTVDQAGVPNKASDGYGYNPSIYPKRGSDEPIPIFDIRYSTTDSEGIAGEGIGTLPKTTILYAPPPPEESDANKGTFNPKALVIFQDSRKPTENDFIINRQFFNSENPEKDMHGSQFDNSIARDSGGTPQGSLIRYQYNQRENTITFYYRDSVTNQWIISTEPYRSTSQANANIYGTRFMGKYIMPNVGNHFIYKWNLFKRTGII